MRRKRIYVLTLFVMFCCCQTFAWEWKPKYAGDIHVGYGTTSSVEGHDCYIGRAILGTLQGVKLNDYLQVGIAADGVMLTHYYKGQGLRFALNAYTDFRGYYPVTKDFSPFIDFGIGAKINLKPSGGDTPLFWQFGPGVKYKKWSLNVGMQKFGKGKGSLTFYSTIGLNF